MLNKNGICNRPVLKFLCGRLTIFATAFFVSACALNGGTSPDDRREHQRPEQSSVEGQVLLTVRLKGRFDLPQALALDYSRQNDAALQSSVGMLQRGLSGQYGDYPILLKLPAGRYRLRALRVAGVERNAEGTLLSRLNQTFDAVSSDTRYIGRLIVSGGDNPAVQPSISWQALYDEDSLLARSSSKALREQEITDASEQPEVPPVAASTERQITIGKVDPSVLHALSNRQKPLFQKFLSAAHPRAFAVGDYGAAGFASGNDAVDLAMTRCARRGNKETCRILAIDDAVVLAVSAPNRTQGIK